MKSQLKFRGETLTVQKHSYQNGRTALQLVDEYGIPAIKPTVNVPEIELGDDEVLIKNWSENEGISKVLQENGITKDTGKRIPVNRVEVEKHKLLLGDE